MAETNVIFALLLTSLLVVVNGDYCMNKCISESQQCHGVCVGVRQCTKCINYAKTCINNCDNATTLRKRRHAFSEKLKQHKRKELGLTRGNFVLDQSAHLFTFWPLSQSECVNREFCKHT